MQICGKTVLITGGAKRIGAAVARRLAGEGCRVIIHCRHSLPEAVRLIGELPGEGHRAVCADLAEEAEVRRLAREAGRFELLVNSAALFFRPGSPEDAAAEAAGMYRRVNCEAPELLLELFFAQNLPEAAAVNITDADAADPPPSPGGYLQSKIDLNALTVRLAPLWAKANYRICAVAPAPMLPPPWAPDSRMSGVLKKSWFGRRVPAEDLTALVSFIFRCDSLTGCVIPLR